MDVSPHVSGILRLDDLPIATVIVCLFRLRQIVWRL